MMGKKSTESVLFFFLFLHNRVASCQTTMMNKASQEVKERVKFPTLSNFTAPRGGPDEIRAPSKV